MSDKIGEVFVEIQGRINKLENELKLAKKKSEQEGKKAGKRFGENFSSSFKTKIKSIGGMIAGAFAVGAVINFGKRLVQTASDFEQIRTRLKSLYGDAEIATKVFNEFKKVASTTPFSLKDVAKGGITLKAFGLNAQETLKSATDLAAFMGTSVPEAASAMGRAFAGGVGAADILRERGILTLIKDFKGIDDLTKLTLPEFRKAMLETFQDTAAGIAGSTSDLSKTYAGAISNMGDAWDNFASAIATGALPVIGNLARGITSLLQKMTPVTDETKEQISRFDYLAATYGRLKLKVNKSKVETDLYNKTIKELKNSYGSYLKNINLEKDSYEEVSKALKNAKINLLDYAKAQVILRKKGEMTAELEAAYEREQKLQKRLTETYLKYQQYRDEGYEVQEEETRIIREINDKIADAKQTQLDIEKEINEYTSQHVELLNRVMESTGKISTTTGKTNEDPFTATEEEIEALNALEDVRNEYAIYQADRLREQSALHQKATEEMIADARRQTQEEKMEAKRREEIARAEFNAKMQISSNFMISISELNSALKGNALASKRLAQAGALIDTYAAANKALASSPPPWNFIAAAAVTAAGLANVAKIEGQGFKTGGDFIVPPGYPNDSFPMAVSSGERVQITPANQVSNSNSYPTNNNNNFNMSFNAQNIDEYFTRTELIPMLNKLVKDYRVPLYASKTV